MRIAPIKTRGASRVAVVALIALGLNAVMADELRIHFVSEPELCAATANGMRIVRVGEK